MRAPEFWWRREASPTARLLSPLGAAYGKITARRMARPGSSAVLPVICVGSLVVGGAGKTPTAITLARMLAERGERPALLTRGYGGRLGGPLAVDAACHTAAQVGDEPLLLARIAPTVVARDRQAGAALATELGASVIVMDDGLQNPSLAKDLALVVVDGRSGIGNGLCLPAGPLRAPLGAQFGRIDAVMLLGEGEAGGRVAAAAAAAGRQVLAARLVPERSAAAALRGRRVLAFAGIGRPEKFFATLAEVGAVVAARLPFPDHHRFSRQDVAAILRRATDGDLVPVTTEKDAARLVGDERAGELVRRLAVLPVSLAFDDEGAVRVLLAASLARRRGQDEPRRMLRPRRTASGEA